MISCVDSSPNCLVEIRKGTRHSSNGLSRSMSLNICILISSTCPTYLAKIRSALYVAIDCITRWIYLEDRSSQYAKDTRIFIKCVEEEAPFTIRTVLVNPLPIASPLVVSVSQWASLFD